LVLIGPDCRPGGGFVCVCTPFGGLVFRGGRPGGGLHLEVYRQTSGRKLLVEASAVTGRAT